MANYKREYLEQFKRISGISDLTLQDVYGALIHLTERQQIKKRGRSLWAKCQFEELYRELLNYDNPYQDTRSDFKRAVEETRWRRKHRNSPVMQMDILNSQKEEHQKQLKLF